MAIDTTTADTPGWWLARLAKRLQAKQNHFNILEDFYIGQHPVPQGQRQRQGLYRTLQHSARSNYTGLVVESVKERLHINGFRAGGTASDQMDQAAWSIWQANSLDAESALVHQNALTYGVGYVIVDADPETPPGGDAPVVTVEDPRQVIHESYPENRRRVRAALKIWIDEVTSQRHAVVYLEGSTSYFTAPPGPGRNSQLLWCGDRDGSAWNWELEAWSSPDDEVDGAPVPNPSGVVPVVPFYNRPRTRPEGVVPLGEFEDVIDVQNRINGVILDRLVISRMQAYRQRWVTGVTPETDSAGNAKRPFDPDVTSLWLAPDADVKFGDFAQTDLTPLLGAISADVTHLAAITRTPPQYLLGQMANLSGDALEAAQAGLVSKVRERQRVFGEAWEQVIRMAGNGVSDDAEVVWADPTQRSLADLANAGVQLQSAGVPWRSRMQALGYDDQAIQRMEAEQAQDSLRAQMLVPVPQQVVMTETEQLGFPNNQPGPGPAASRVPPPAAPTPPATDPATEGVG